jgi:hypothetical protein
MREGLTVAVPVGFQFVFRPIFARVMLVVTTILAVLAVTTVLALAVRFVLVAVLVLVAELARGRGGSRAGHIAQR